MRDICPKIGIYQNWQEPRAVKEYNETARSWYQVDTNAQSPIKYFKFLFPWILALLVLDLFPKLSLSSPIVDTKYPGD